MKKTDLDIDGIMQWLDQEVWDVTRHMAFTALNVAQALTRVRYGRARASWGMGSPGSSNHDPGPLTEENKLSPQQATMAALNHISGVGEKVPPGGPKPIEVASYVDYMIWLDQGTDHIEPGHMADHAIRAAAESFGNYMAYMEARANDRL